MHRSVAPAVFQLSSLNPLTKQHAAQHQVELLRWFFSAGVLSVTQIIIPRSGRIAAALQALKFSRFGPASFLPFPQAFFPPHTLYRPNRRFDADKPGCLTYCVCSSPTAYWITEILSRASNTATQRPKERLAPPCLEKPTS